MTRPADFADAHRRHWEDAELLFKDARWANADHLYGLSAESGLKAVMIGLGMQVEARGAPTDARFRKHVRELWSEFGHFVMGRGRPDYVPAGDPFANWSIHDRYANRRHFADRSVAPHRQATFRVRRLIKRARRDGVL